MNGLSEVYKLLLTKFGVILQNLDFSAKNRDFGPKKRSLLNGHHVLATTGISCSKKKVAFCQLNIRLLWNFGCFFWIKMHFWPKKHCSAEHKSGCFSVIPARNGSVVILDYFLMARTVPSFVENGPKFRVFIPLKSEWSKTAKNRGEPRKMTHCWGKRNFFWGWSELESCSHGHTCDMPCWRKSRLPYKKWLFAKSIQIFGSKKHIFAPSGQLEPHRSMFSIKKKVSHWFPDMRIPKVLLPPPKNGFLAQKQPN